MSNELETKQDNAALTQTSNDAPVIAPFVDIYETDDELVFKADMPGVANDAVDVRFEKGELTFEGRRRSKIAAIDDEVVYRRSFTMPKGIMPDNIGAHFAYGVLTVEVPKANVAQTRQIPINAG